jgi:hypothetical protein
MIKYDLGSNTDSSNFILNDLSLYTGAQLNELSEMAIYGNDFLIQLSP